jgi:type I restriction enzyme S subunit
MMVDASEGPRASIVQFRGLHRWSVNSFIETDWHWPVKVIRPLSTALTRKSIDVNREVATLDGICLVTLHFDGEMELRHQSAGKSFKGRLFYADPGDVIYSKIDVRNGAIGIVSEELGRVCVSSEFPVYTIDWMVAEARYIKLMFRTDVFRRKINSMISGASGRKRVQPVGLESVEVPVPPLSVQRKIVAGWESAQKSAAAIAAKINGLEREIESRFLAALGLKAPKKSASPKAFVVRFADVERWAVDHNQQIIARLDPEEGRYPVVTLQDVIANLENGWSPKCLDRLAHADEWGVLKMGAVSFGAFDQRQNKAIPPALSKRPSLEVHEGDFLISRANITRLVGACALVGEARPGLMLCDKIFRAVWREPSPVDARYLDEILKTQHLRQQIEGAVTGTSATMKNITKPALLSLRFPLPPLLVQQEMMKRVDARRGEIVALKKEAEVRAGAAKAAVELMILGTKPV